MGRRSFGGSLYKAARTVRTAEQVSRGRWCPEGPECGCRPDARQGRILAAVVALRP